MSVISYVALDKQDGKEFIMGEFVDLVFELEKKSTSRCGVHHWFLKQEAKLLLPEACDRLYN